MFSFKNMRFIFKVFIISLMPSLSFSDVLVDVTAKMIEPSCDIYSENNSSLLKINFGILNLSELNELNSSNDFSLYISGCNLSKNLAIVLNPKEVNTLLYKGKKILRTNIDGLGINFGEVTNGITRPLEINQIQRIYPERISDYLYRIDLRANLVNLVPITQLELGKFSTSVIISVTYY